MFLAIPNYFLWGTTFSRHESCPPSPSFHQGRLSATRAEMELEAHTAKNKPKKYKYQKRQFRKVKKINYWGLMVTVEVKPFVFWHLCVSPWAYFFRSRKYTELNSAIKYTQSTTQIYLETKTRFEALCWQVHHDHANGALSIVLACVISQHRYLHWISSEQMQLYQNYQS